MFSAYGGTAVANLTVEYGKTITSLTAPAKDGYKLIGWYSDSSLTTEFIAIITVTEDLILYTKWANDGVVNEGGCGSLAFSKESFVPLLCFSLTVACLLVLIKKNTKRQKK